MVVRDALLAGLFGEDEESLRVMQALLDGLGVAEIVAVHFERVPNGDDWLIATELGIVEAQLRLEPAGGPVDSAASGAAAADDAGAEFVTSGDARLTAWPDVREIELSTRALLRGQGRLATETRVAIAAPRFSAVETGRGELAEFGAALLREQRRRRHA